MLREGQSPENQSLNGNYADCASPDVTTAADAMISLRNSNPQSLNANTQYTFSPEPNASHIDDAYSNKSDSQTSPGTGSQRKEREFIPNFKKDGRYWVKRQKNNVAAKRSREKRRMNDAVMGQRILELTSENTRLKEELETLKRRFGISLDQPFLPKDPITSSPRQDRITSNDNATQNVILPKRCGNLSSTSANLGNNSSAVGMSLNVSASTQQPVPQSCSVDQIRTPPALIANQRMTANNNNNENCENNNFTSNNGMPPLIPLISMTANSYTGSVMHAGPGSVRTAHVQQVNAYAGSMCVPMTPDSGRDRVNCEGLVITTMQSLAQNQYHEQDGGQTLNNYYPESPDNGRGLPSSHDTKFSAQPGHYQGENRSSIAIRPNCYQDGDCFNNSGAVCVSYTNDHARKEPYDSSCESPGRLQICCSPVLESNLTERQESCESPLNLTKRKRKIATSDGTFDSSDSEEDDEQKRYHKSYIAYVTNGKMPVKVRHKINSTEQSPQECSEADMMQGCHIYSKQNSQGLVFADGSSTDSKYFDRRGGNSMAAKKCRENRGYLHDIRTAKSFVLESENSHLLREIQSLTNEVTHLKCLVKTKRESPPPVTCE